jgi:signal peptidase II
MIDAPDAKPSEAAPEPAPPVPVAALPDLDAGIRVAGAPVLNGSIANGAPTRPYRPAYVFLGALAMVVLVADLWSKRWAESALALNGATLPPRQIIKGRFNFHLAHNPGGAWGMFHDQPEALRKPFFVLVSVIAVAVIIAMFRKLDGTQRALKWGLPMVLGGALGNLVDRMRFGKVVDFIDVIYWTTKDGTPIHWPTFNVADIAICIGVGLMAVDFLFPGNHRRPSSSPLPPRVRPSRDAAKSTT